jgi:hypothetical protein
MTIKIENLDRCNYDEDGCVGTIDEKYTVNFDDIGELPVKFCGVCGPKAHKRLNDFLNVMRKADPDIFTAVEKLIADAEKLVALHKN